MKVVIVHGWEGYPDNCWFPWLKKELEERGFEVIVPEMPNTEEPEIKSWVGKLAEVVGEVDENTYFIGHSIGCQAIMRYLESIDVDKVGGVIFVAGFFNLSTENYEEADKEIAKPWIETSIDTDKIKKMGKFTGVFSDDDPDVNIEESEKMKERLDAEIIIEHNKGHFSDNVGVTELPIVLDKLMEVIE